jgi:hypothetical protein
VVVVYLFTECFGMNEVAVIGILDAVLEKSWICDRWNS